MIRWLRRKFGHVCEHGHHRRLTEPYPIRDLCVYCYIRWCRGQSDRYAKMPGMRIDKTRKTHE